MFYFNNYSLYRFTSGFRIVAAGFKGFHIAIFIWSCIYSIACCTYFCFLTWADVRRYFSPKCEYINTYFKIFHESEKSAFFQIEIFTHLISIYLSPIFHSFSKLILAQILFIKVPIDILQACVIKKIFIFIYIYIFQYSSTITNDMNVFFSADAQKLCDQISIILVFLYYVLTFLFIPRVVSIFNLPTGSAAIILVEQVSNYIKFSSKFNIYAFI